MTKPLSQLSHSLGKKGALRTSRRAVVLLAFRWGWQNRQWPKQEGGREEAGLGHTHMPRGLLDLRSPNLKIFQNRAVQMGTKDQLEAVEVVKLETWKSCSRVWRLCQQLGR